MPQLRLKRSLMVLTAFLGALVIAPTGKASLINVAPVSLSLTNTRADGFLNLLDATSFMITGGNDGSGLSGTTDVITKASSAGTVQFDFSYLSLDTPGSDAGGYINGKTRVVLADTDGQGGSSSFSVQAGDAFGFFVSTADNTGEPGMLTITLSPQAPTVPEPATWGLFLIGLSALAVKRFRNRGLPRKKSGPLKGLVCVGLPVLCLMNSNLSAQNRNSYVPTKITGQLTLVRTVNPILGASRLFGAAVAGPRRPEISKVLTRFPHPAMPRLLGAVHPLLASLIQSQPVIRSGIFGFDGLTHSEQRQANSGNQFSVEPPNPSVAVANNFILEGVNNAVRVYSTSGTPLTRVISSNELFGLAPALNRSTGANGVFPTDMRVYFDQDINRWFVLQRAQDNDINGNPLDSSHLYMAVSQGTDPTGIYNIYVMDTTNSGNAGCPCIADFPQIGSDQYGFYISANEYGTSSQSFVDAVIFGISKSALASGTAAPPTYRFLIPRSTGFEFTIQPAVTPPGGSHFIANGGVEFFASSQSSIATDNNIALWALSNTASLQQSTATLLLSQITVGSLQYRYPDVATQRPGPLPYGSTLSPAGQLAFIDGGVDSRILSLSYAGGRLFATLATQLTDENGRSLVGGAYVVMSPTLRSGILAGSVVKQGYLVAASNHVLRPAVAVNAQGRGAIAFTLVGPDYYPSAAFVAIDASPAQPSVIQIAAVGTAAEDGFTGYQSGFGAGDARWGDYTTAVAGTDGSIWMVTEYIPTLLNNLVPPPFANWGTFVSHFTP